MYDYKQPNLKDPFKNVVLYPEHEINSMLMKKKDKVYENGIELNQEKSQYNQFNKFDTIYNNQNLLKSGNSNK